MTLKRRTFLGLMGVSSIATGLQLAAPLAARAAPKTVAYAGRLYRWDGSNRIFVSTDGGGSWGEHANLGPGRSVKKLAVDQRNRLNATVAFGSWSFGLVLASDLVAWRTA